MEQPDFLKMINTPENLIKEVLAQTGTNLPVPKPGIDFEPEDRSVGIMTSCYIFTGQDEKTYVMFNDGELRVENETGDETVATSPATDSLYTLITKMYDEEKAERKPNRWAPANSTTSTEWVRKSESTEFHGRNRINLPPELEKLNEVVNCLQAIHGFTGAALEHSGWIDIPVKSPDNMAYGIAFGFETPDGKLGWNAYGQDGDPLDGDDYSGVIDVTEEDSPEDIAKAISMLLKQEAK